MSRLTRIIKAVAPYVPDEVEKPVLNALGLSDLAAKKPKPLAAKPTTAAKRVAAEVTTTKAPAIIKKVSGANKRASDKVSYDREKLARQYPDLAPPSAAIDKNTGKPFPQKEKSDEAKALEKTLAVTRREMARDGYTPYFNPEERFYVDPAPYNLQGNTLVDSVAKRPDTIEKYEALAQDPAAMDRLRAAYERGSEYPGAKDWYAMGQLEDAFIQEYGPEMGRQMFKERFADSMAATTGGADPTSNLLMAVYGNLTKEAGDNIPVDTYNLPFPIGGRFAKTNTAMFEKLINRGEGLTTANPKRFNFSADFLGDTSRATIDEQMSGMFDPKMTAPPKGSYGIYERALGDLAKMYGVPPANFQDVSWAGGKLVKTPNFQPKPMIQIVNDAIERTARVTGQDPEEVVYESMIKAKRPMYAHGGYVE
jgi:hypothetical protein